MNNVIKPNTKIKILSREHLDYIENLAEQYGFSRYMHNELSRDIATYIVFYKSREYCLGANLYDFDHSYDMEEIFIPMPEASPKPPFKLRNANHPVVRQWLKDQGCRFTVSSLDVLTSYTNETLVFVSEDMLMTFMMIGYEREFEQHPYPELTLNLAVTSWEMPEPIDKAKLERIERIKAIEAELDKLKQMDA